mmetsp:Transcript_44131/g.66524  ORF Transcript_44131/g.66524 Transcript_44131/m.66524 type:complete len:140 (-) Transcript_44131:960-1379(-)
MLSLRFKRLLVVIKQTAYEEYSQKKKKVVDFFPSFKKPTKLLYIYTLLLFLLSAQIARTSTKSPPLETPRITLRIPQNMRHQPPIHPTTSQRRLCLHQSRGIRSTAPERRGFSGGGRWRWHRAERRSLFGSRHHTAAGN